MRHSRIAGQALRLAAEPSRQPYICRKCLAQAARKFSTSPLNYADSVPFWKRLQNTIFRTDQSKEQEKVGEEQRKRMVKDAADRDKTAVQTKTREDGRVFEVAAAVDPYTDGRYIPSATWNGLERVGGRQWAKARADQGEQYFGFLSKSQRQLSSIQWQKLLHHITVEALVLQKAGRNAIQVCNPRRNDGNGVHWIGTANATIASENDLITVAFAEGAKERDVLDAITEDETLTSEEDLKKEILGATDLDLTLQYADDTLAWMQISLRDPELKLAIVKRTMQLTGKRIRDPTISRADTLADFYNAVKVKETPKKLAQTENLKLVAAQMANVKVHETRRTVVHKEKEIGRWKIIEDELNLRGLPVFGTTYAHAKEGLKHAAR